VDRAGGAGAPGSADAARGLERRREGPGDLLGGVPGDGGGGRPRVAGRLELPPAADLGIRPRERGDGDEFGGLPAPAGHRSGSARGRLRRGRRTPRRLRRPRRRTSALPRGRRAGPDGRTDQRSRPLGGPHHRPRLRLDAVPGDPPRPRHRLPQGPGRLRRRQPPRERGEARLCAPAPGRRRGADGHPHRRAPDPESGLGERRSVRVRRRGLPPPGDGFPALV
jgi:hypothetical protein